MKRNSIKIVIAIIIVIIFVIGFSYAYFSNTKKSDNRATNAGNLRITYSDENLDNIHLSNIAPINDDEIKTKASKLEFKVTNTGSNKSYVDIYLDDIVLPDELASLEFKWALYSGDEKVYNGNFRNILDNKQLLINNTELAKNESKTYQLYIWVSENGLNQNNTMNKSFSAKILVNASQKKGNDLLTKVIKDNNPFQTDTPDFTKAATTDEGLFKAEDADGETYYFRGAVEDNYVKLGTRLWRIVRINGDNTIRLVDNDVEGKSVFNTSYNNEKYVGYTYDNSEANKQDGTPSTIKTYIDNWYSENMASSTDPSKNFDKLIANTRFCNDTTVSSTSGVIIYYGAYDRLITNKEPTYKCSNTTKTYGGEYDLKVGLLSADEASFAGAAWEGQNKKYYLYKDYLYWLGAPSLFRGASYYAGEFRIFENGTLSGFNGSVTNKHSVIPVISLRGDTLLSKGDGTKKNPYAIKFN